MMILLEHDLLPKRGTVHLMLQRDFTINVTAEEARRQVDRWLFDQVSYMMSAEAPTLVLGERVVWRVPAVLTAPHVGRVGAVGAVDVDVQTGQMNVTPELIVAFQQAGIELGKLLPPYQAGRQLPAEYWATDLQPTRPKPNRRADSISTPITTP